MTSAFDIRNTVIGELPRTLRLQTLESWYDGTAYADRSYPWERERDDAGKPIPLEQRRPKQLGIARYIVNTSAGWLFGENRFPGIQAEGDDVTGNWIAVLSEAMRLPSVFLQAAKSGGKCGTAILVGKVAHGYLRTEALEAKHCIARFGPDGESVAWLREQYKAPADFFEAKGYEGIDPRRWYWHRREFTPMGEHVYHLVPVSHDGTPPDFERAGLDTERTVEHKLGVLAAVWVRNLPTMDPQDGESSFAGVLDLLEPADVLFSVSYRSIRKLSDPTLALTGVPDPDQLDEYVAKMGTSRGGLVASPGDAKLLEMSGTGQEAAKTWLGDLRQSIAQVSRVVSLDPEKLSGSAQSGYALEILHAPLIGLVGELRQQYGPALVRFVRLMLELCTKVLASGGSIELPRPVEGLPNPKAVIALKWGRYFQPTALDIKTETENLLAGVAGKLISLKTARARYCFLHGVEDLEAEATRIDAERGQDPEHAMSEAIRQLTPPGGEA